MVDRKALLESEKAELEAILKEIPEDDFLVRPGLEGRLEEIEMELSSLRESEDMEDREQENSFTIIYADIIGVKEEGNGIVDLSKVVYDFRNSSVDLKFSKTVRGLHEDIWGERLLKLAGFGSFHIKIKRE